MLKGDKHFVTPRLFAHDGHSAKLWAGLLGLLSLFHEQSAFHQAFILFGLWQSLATCNSCGPRDIMFKYYFQISVANLGVTQLLAAEQFAVWLSRPCSPRVLWIRGP